MLLLSKLAQGVDTGGRGKGTVSEMQPTEFQFSGLLSFKEKKIFAINS
jgi:hypothetical protein